MGRGLDIRGRAIRVFVAVEACSRVEEHGIKILCAEGSRRKKKGQKKDKL